MLLTSFAYIIDENLKFSSKTFMPIFMLFALIRITFNIFKIAIFDYIILIYIILYIYICTKFKKFH